MREPLLIVTDGNPGVLKAIAEVFPRSLKQRCQKHRLENILGKAPKEVRDELKAAILESFHANSYEQGLKKGREVIAALVHNSDRGRELAWPRLPSSGHLAIRHPERRHGVENLAPDPCLNSLCRQPSRSHR